jgi:hypothetical protein
VTALLEDRGVDRDTRSEVEALFREARRRRRRRWVIGSCAVVLAAALGLSAGLMLTVQMQGGGDRTTTPRTTPTGPALRGAATHHGATNLDILSGSLQTRVRFDVRTDKASSIPAAPGLAPPLALSREGYVIGRAMGPRGQYASISNGLQRVLYSWPSNDGSYPAPASDSADVWLTGPDGRPYLAQEYDGRGHAVGPPVTIPAGMLVLGEVGTTIVLQGPPPDQNLALWDPREARLVSTLGPRDQVATSGSTLAWTTGALLRVATPSGSVVRAVDGPPGDWATSLAFSPTGRQIAVVWAPHPGSAWARTRASVNEQSTLVLVDTGSGLRHFVPGSRGATGPVAWAPGGGRLFFGRALGGGSSAAVASYEVGAPRATTLLHLRGVNLPQDFDAATGTLVAWTAP